ncbi:MAG: hypothetical protein ACJ708_09185 [Nitrososphaeraceae archaeon]
MPKKELKEDAIDLRRERVLELTSQVYVKDRLLTCFKLRTEL